jgi:hypothetical protein
VAVQIVGGGGSLQRTRLCLGIPWSAGNYQGIFARISIFGHICLRQASEITALYQKIPYARDQGTSSAEQGSQIVE